MVLVIVIENCVLVRAQSFEVVENYIFVLLCCAHPFVAAGEKLLSTKLSFSDKIHVPPMSHARNNINNLILQSRIF
jgi:hypothetical protein